MSKDRRCLDMKRLKVYLDTSVISYLDQKDAPEKMEETLRLWALFRKEIYEVYISVRIC